MEPISSDRIRPMFQEATFNQDWLLMITTAIAGTVDGGPKGPTAPPSTVVLIETIESSRAPFSKQNTAAQVQ